MVAVNKKKQKNGFTIVEMMTVVTVIGVLIGITIFMINGWRINAAESEVASDLNGVVSAMESARTFSTGYPASIPSTFKASQNVTVTLKSSTTTSFCAEAASKVVTSVIFKVSSADKTPRAGTC